MTPEQRIELLVAHRAVAIAELNLYAAKEQLGRELALKVQAFQRVKARLEKEVGGSIDVMTGEVTQSE